MAPIVAPVIVGRSILGNVIESRAKEHPDQDGCHDKCIIIRAMIIFGASIGLLILVCIIAYIYCHLHKRQEAKHLEATRLRLRQRHSSAPSPRPAVRPVPRAVIRPPLQPIVNSPQPSYTSSSRRRHSIENWVLNNPERASTLQDVWREEQRVRREEGVVDAMWGNRAYAGFRARSGTSTPTSVLTAPPPVYTLEDTCPFTPPPPAYFERMSFESDDVYRNHN